MVRRFWVRELRVLDYHKISSFRVRARAGIRLRFLGAWV